MTQLYYRAGCLSDTILDHIIVGCVFEFSDSFNNLTPSSPNIYGNQELTQLAALYEKLKGGYATADATVSLQSIFP